MNFHARQLVVDAAKHKKVIIWGERKVFLILFLSHGAKKERKENEKYTRIHTRTDGKAGKTKKKKLHPKRRTEMQVANEQRNLRQAA